MAVYEAERHPFLSAEIALLKGRLAEGETLSMMLPTAGDSSKAARAVSRSKSIAGYVVRVSRREGYALTENVLRLSAGVRHRDNLLSLCGW